jgi:hypothetical protein
MAMMGMLTSKKNGDGIYYPGDDEFLSGIKQAEVIEKTPQAAWAIYMMLTVVVTAVIWAFNARVEQITKAEGRVVSDGREQVIASLEGGILRSTAERRPGQALGTQWHPCAAAGRINWSAADLPDRGDRAAADRAR